MVRKLGAGPGDGVAVPPSPRSGRASSAVGRARLRWRPVSARLGRRIEFGQHRVNVVLAVGRAAGAGAAGFGAGGGGAGLRWRGRRRRTARSGGRRRLLGGAAVSGALAGLLASSSAMMRRMEARISSIDGSCAFAGWVIPQKSRHTPYVPRSDSAAIANANRCRIPFIRQSRADLADGKSRPRNELWTRDAASRSAIRRSASVGGAHAGPGVAHLLVVHVGVIDRHPQAEHLRRQPADRRQQRDRTPPPGRAARSPATRAH